MAVITVNVSNLCIFGLLMLSVMANVMELTPLCGTMDGSPPKDSDKIYFKDKNQRIRTIEVNGTIFACYPDGTMVEPNSSSSAENSDERTINGSQLNDRIHDDERNLTQRDVSITRYIANLSRCATNNQTFCTTDATYPLGVIEKLLRKHLHKFADVFGTDMISSDIINRSDAFDEITLCDSFEQVIYPTSGKNKNGEELYIFNTPEHKQGIRVSMCRNKGAACRMTENFPNGYRTECKQHFVYRELLSLSPEGVPIKEKFEFPACCSCAVYRG
ncbi:protein spaetzle-like isoform X2 [Sitodiplosis mosellana]|uniref:protein spaetzle-like isoform X2 n=1 Tax=Sitodiplosis mosellana TaxID=263140 RepID=UPI0024437714|nr:protein spaetzle-like isoform X2 [Sitodiplosis mosellana]